MRAWTRKEITDADLASAVRQAVKYGVKPETIDSLLRDLDLVWDALAGNLRPV